MNGASDDFGPRLRAERLNAGLSLARLAELTGLSKGYLQRLESEPSNPSLQVLKQIADALDLTIADVLGAPRMRFEPNPEAIPASLRRFADDQKLSDSEIRQLASIRFRKGEEPHTSQRWRFILDSLKASRSLETER